MISIIVAVAKNGIIGGNNSLLWHISEDLRNFKRITSGHGVIMGRKSYESIGRPLPNRHNVVITRQDISIEGCSVVHSLEEALALSPAEEEVFIIGGGEIYTEAMPLATKFYLTRVEHDYEGDTRFPEWDEMQWQLVERTEFERGERYEHPFAFECYLRREAIIKVGAEAIPTIQRLAAVAFPATYSEIISPEQIDFMMEWMYGTEAMERQIASSFQYFLVYLMGKVVGYFAIERHGEKEYELQRLYLLPEAQGFGIGRKMLRHTFEYVRGVAGSGTRLTLHVNRNNRATGFYEQMGMHIDKELDTEISPGFFMNDYIYAKEL